MNNLSFTPVEFALDYLKQKYPPTPEQAAIIGAPREPMLVVAGAGAGKTETMAARAVWLVVTTDIRPEEILGLTFTRKAARELGQRIRQRLNELKKPEILRALDPSGKLAEKLAVISPTILTYDAYISRILREYGLLLPADTDCRVVSEMEMRIIIRRFLRSSAALYEKKRENDLIDIVYSLMEARRQNLINLEDIREESLAAKEHFLEAQAAAGLYRGKPRWASTIDPIVVTQDIRRQAIDIIERIEEYCEEESLTTYGAQTAQAAALVQKTQEPARGELAKFRAVMLDEYQDTSFSQRAFLSSLFGKGIDPNLAITAVGDPMQGIYSWRGADIDNLQHFLNDFPRIIEEPNGEKKTLPALSMALTTSWRNPDNVLKLANNIVAGSNIRGVEKLHPRQGAGTGTVHYAFYPNQEKEREAIRDFIHTHYWQAHQKGEEKTAAILVRKHQHAMPIAKLLVAAGIPVQLPPECIIDIPEVALLIQLAQLIIEPDNDAAAMKILTHPLIHLAPKDLKALYERAQFLSKKKQEHEPVENHTPLERFEYELEKLQEEASHLNTGLGSAIADLGEKENYSPQGYTRLHDLQKKLRAIRKESLNRSIPEIFIDIEKKFGIRIEVLSHEDPYTLGNPGTVHLDKFLDIAVEFSHIRGATLESFLEYLNSGAKAKDLPSGNIQQRKDCVQIMTVHASKGLEWDVVCVPVANKSDYGAPIRKSTWLTDPRYLPSSLSAQWEKIYNLVNNIGIDILQKKENKKKNPQPIEACDFFDQDGAILWDKDPKDVKEALTGAYKELEREEGLRLFYVALTRSAQALLITGSQNTHTTQAKGEEDLLPEFITIHEKFPELCTHWATEEECAQAHQHYHHTNKEGFFKTNPLPVRYTDAYREDYNHGAQLIEHTTTRNRKEHTDTSILSLWEQEVSAIIEEHNKEQNPDIRVPLPRNLTTTECVNVAKNAEEFARNLARPIPFKPNRYAKQGTAFHLWVENHYSGQGSLWEGINTQPEFEAYFEHHDTDPAEIENFDDGTIERLKEKFRNSSWYNRQAALAEQGFEISIGGKIIRGRIDALFHEGEDLTTGWTVVDWKTGQPPKGKDKEAAAVQLAVYRIGAARILNHKYNTHIQPEDIRAMFYYVSYDYNFEPQVLLTEQEIAQLGTHIPKQE